MPWLPTITTFINLLSMAGSLWLGFYLVTRSPHRPLPWLAALSLWSLASLFLRNILVIHLPASETLNRLRLVGVIGLAFWFHLTLLLVPRRHDRVAQATAYPAIRAGMIGLAYGLSFLVILSNFFAPGSVLTPSLSPVYISGRASGAFNPYIILYMLVFGSFAIYNLVQGRAHARHASQKRILTSMLVVTSPPLLAGLYLTLGPRISPTLPVFPADAIMGVSMLLLGYNVARYNALIEGRTVERDALYSMMGTGVAVAVYAVVVLLLYLNGHASVLTLVLILGCVIVSHSLYDGVRTALDRLFYRGQFRQLRANLRLLSREAGTGQDLTAQLRSTLGALCYILHVQKGFIALRRGDIYIVELAEGTDLTGRRFPPSALDATEITALPHPRSVIDLNDMVWIVPLAVGGAQIGVLVLGAKQADQPYKDEDLELLDDVADQISTAIYASQLQEGYAQTINEMVASFRERERTLQWQMQSLLARPAAEPWPVLGGMDEEKFIACVEECLRNLHDFAYLGEHALAQLKAIHRQLDHQKNGPVTHVDRGRALREFLLQTLEKLRPSGREPTEDDVPAREWHQFIILRDAYVQGKLTRDVMNRLYISEPTFHRTRRRAVRSVAKMLHEMEQSAL
ncbi:MAG: GAF domain-containing protein [Anaerolineae bacterium]|nr:GAF domain-containing protein [Anaerolineae bacterium]